MNNQLQKFARDKLKEGLAILPESHRLFFKKMYSPDNLKADIIDVVNNMSEDRLDWAMQQVQRTLDKCYEDKL